MINLDTNNNDVPDSWEPYSIEGAAQAAETIPQGRYAQFDWSVGGKMYGPGSN